MKNGVHLIDCMEYMKDIPDNYFELAIVDPEYGIDLKGPCGHSQKWGGIQSVNNNPPEKLYFQELERVSVNYFIWGANYFDLKGHRCVIVWDKGPTIYGRSFSECEIAESTFNEVSRIAKIPPNQTNKIHPTQKPVALYKWLLKNYAKPGDKIFDSHVGSGSIRIACHDLGFEFTGCEFDEDYWRAQEERYKNHIEQAELFGSDEIQKLVYKEVK